MSGRARQASCSSATSRLPSSGRPRRKAAAERTLADRWKHTPQSSTTRSSRWPSNCVKSRCPRWVKARSCSRSAPCRSADRTSTRRTKPIRGRSTFRSSSATSSAEPSPASAAAFAASAKATASSARPPRRSAASACCAEPDATTCVPSRKGFGYGIDGAMAQWVRVPARCLHRIPDSLPFDIACLCEPHAVAYQSMCVNSVIHPGDLVVVLGPGPIGLLCARMAALSGADPLIVAGVTADAPRLETARTPRGDADGRPAAGGFGRSGARLLSDWCGSRLRCDRSEPAARGRASSDAPGRAGHRRWDGLRTRSRWT